MAAAYVKKLVQLNLGVDDAAFAQAIEVKEDEGVDASEAYFKRGDAAVKLIMDDACTSGALFFFWAPAHGDATAADILHCCAPTMTPSGHGRRSVHFLKLGPVKEGSADELMDCLQFGACTANVLSDMVGLLSGIFIPSLEAQPVEDPTPGQLAYSRNLQTFQSVLENASKQVSGDVSLEIPGVDVAKPVDEAALGELEQAVEVWTKTIQGVVDVEKAARPNGPGPLAEVDFWKNRHQALGALYEQLQATPVTAIIAVLKKADAHACIGFSKTYDELQKLSLEAKDNTKFLATLERHFKTLQQGSFSTILDTLPSMLNAIRMVWIISRHYNSEMRMVPLMERIAHKLAEKVQHEVNVTSILAKEPKEAQRIITQARAVLHAWEATYMSTRQRIEEAGNHIRWEFDRKRLFELTRYMAHVCGHLFDVAQVLDQFDQFLGPELRAVTDDTSAVDAVCNNVEALKTPLTTIAYDAFDRRYKESWQELIDAFNADVASIEEQSKHFIDDAFQKLRSAEGAFALVENFQNIKSRESINQQFTTLYDEVMEQYMKELASIHGLFDRHKVAPPIYENYPDTAGAIAWARDLYHRAKKPILKFKQHVGLLETPEGIEAKQKYLVFARAVDAYITSLFEGWVKGLDIATDCLKQPILAAVKPVPETAKRKGPAKFRMPPLPYRVNFVPELKLIIKEAKYLDRLGFTIPETALQIALQEDKFHGYVRDLSLKLNRYDALIKSIAPVEADLLTRQVANLQRTLRSGFTPLNWNSQRVPAFIEAVQKALNEFQGVVNQIQKSAQMISGIVEAISTTVLFQPADFKRDPRTKRPVFTDVGSFYELVEATRTARLNDLSQRYKSIEPLLKKVEEVVASTASSASPLLSNYYAYWEKRLCNAMVVMVSTSLATFHELLKHPDCAPFCRAACLLGGRDVVVSPPAADVLKYVTKCIRGLSDAAKTFPRWKRGTCIECPPIIVDEDEEPFVFSFHQDLSKNPHIVTFKAELVDYLTSLTDDRGAIQAYKDSWKIYDTEHGLWDEKARRELDKLTESANPPGVVFFDAKLETYAGLAHEALDRARTWDVDFLRIDADDVAKGVAKQALSWRDQYGKVLRDVSKAKMDLITDQWDQWRRDIDGTQCDEIEKLMFVLNTIAKVVDASMDMELKYANVAERYRTLERHEVKVETMELKTAHSLAETWRELYVFARTKDLRLAKVKEEFRTVTTEQSDAFQEELKELRTQFYAEGPVAGKVSLEEGVLLMVDYRETLDKCTAKKDELVNAEDLFGMEMTAYPVLVEIQTEMSRMKIIYDLYSAFEAFRGDMSLTAWGELDLDILREGVDKAEKEIKKLPKDLKELSKYKAYELVVVSFKESLPVIVNLKNDAVKEPHWSQIEELTGVSIGDVKTITLGKIFSMELAQYGEDVDEIVVCAINELKIEKEVYAIEKCWSTTSLDVKVYSKDGAPRGHVLAPAEEIYLQLEDHLLNLQTMSGSRFVGRYAGKVREWEKMLNLVVECLEVWFNVQRKWMYLESIFIGSEDIRMQLPEEAKKFDKINKEFKTIMKCTHEHSVVVHAATQKEFDSLTEMGDRLDKCQKSLTDYLDTKRNAFSRFYFISDDELLSVLGSSDPTSIQVHMLKLFDNVKELKFGSGAAKITGMVSSEKEGFDLQPASPVDGPVEVWMGSVEQAMKDSLQIISKTGIYNYAGQERSEWILDPDVLGMVTLAGSLVWWTWEVEDAFRSVREGDKHAMKTLEARLTKQLVQLVAMVRQDLTKINRKKVNTLLIIDVHSRDIVDLFIRESILNAKEFAWESQLRFYWDRDVDDCVIQQCTGNFRYGYEYMGLNGRLVITPLTDRCYMTITQALTFKLGGSPAGPAGTGKTETVKDLAKSLALPCFVINCGDGLDYKAMGSIFSGLVQVGAWGCFDEFNRINIEVLSVVSAQLRSIQNALLRDEPSCNIGNGSISVKRVAGFATCGFFITMNPGYAGRTELPDNLKALFRPVTMIVPDLQMICEIMLFSEGFEGAKVLARKMTVLYKLSKEQLSKQYHYDFGLRSLKSVLVMAGGLKRQYSDLREDIVLMRVLRDSNMPKYVFEDVPLFIGLIKDLFPGLEAPRVGFEELKLEVAKQLTQNGFKCSDQAVHQEQIDKVIQMYETMIVRHTTMIVGPTGGGKTLVLDTLKAARLKAEGVTVKYCVINPKAQPTDELYGIMDPVTRDWTDGVLSRLFRELNGPLPKAREGKEMRWIIYDGDVDAVWVENMNSVMDDNRLLTLPNGERIRLQPHVCMICETFDLQYASPATISRCGMVWADPKNLGYRPYFERWLRQRCGDGVEVIAHREEEAEQLQSLFDQYCQPCIDYVQLGLVDGELGAKLRMVVPITSIAMVKQLCTALDAFLQAVYDQTPDDLPERDDLENVFAFCIAWSIGAPLVGSSQGQFNEFVHKIATCSLPDGLLSDSVYDPSSKRWQTWESRVAPYVEPKPFRFYEVIVPTTDSTKFSYLLRELGPRKPVLFVGASGTAKTTIINDYLAGLSDEATRKLTIGFSSRTSSADVQRNIEVNVDKRTGNIYGPPLGTNLVVFIDDMNMPKVDTYGTQQPITLLLTLISRGFIYDREKDLTQKILKDMTYIGAMGPPGGGRNNVDPRFVALFSVFNLPDPTPDLLKYMYSSIISQRLRDFSPGVKDAAAKIPEAVLELFGFILERLPPTPAKFHYIFNLSDLSRVTEGVCLASPEVLERSEQLIRLFRNEVQRIFCDRLVSDEDLAAVEGKLGDVIGSTWPDAKEHALENPLIFGDFERAVARLTEDAEDARLYKDMGDFGTTRKIMDAVLEDYNLNRTPQALVLFEMALSHLTRVHRIIRLPRGNALLVGVGGSGKQSLTRLATYCAGYDIFSIQLMRGYGELEFREDLKTLYKLLGTQEVVFLFTDAHVALEGFLEFLNNMLTTGMVPALYEQDEMDGLANSVAKECKKEGITPTPGNLWKFYVNKCRNNLHLVLAMSPSGDKLRLRCRSFPGLISNCVIDWFFPWPEDALSKVAEFFLAEVDLPEKHRAAIVQHLVFSHTHVVKEAARFAETLRRYYYVTPKNYLDYIQNYHAQLSYNEKKVGNSVKRLAGGLSKLVDAARDVDRMSIELKDAQVIVSAKTVEVETLIEQITEKTTIANKQKGEAEVMQAEASEQSIVIAREKGKADAALEEAIPALEMAESALANLHKEDITEVKSMAKPPALVMDACLMVVCLRPTGVKLDETWGDAKKMLADTSLLDKLKRYPKDAITEKMMKSVRKYFKNPKMTVENMKNVSKAGTGLLVWVTAISKYFDVARNVEPLKAMVRNMEKAAAKTTKLLSDLNGQLGVLSKDLGELDVMFKEKSEELNGLQTQAALMEKRLAAASKLITGLTGERTRWTADIGDLNNSKVQLVGDCLLAASFLSYAGAFTSDFRAVMIYDTFAKKVASLGVPVTAAFNLESFLSFDAVIQDWTAKGLPADEHSVQNGILTTAASRFPLCIDPQQQAVNWIKNMYGKAQLKIKSLSESDFMKHLELAIQFGAPFLFENVDEELDPMLDPVLEKNTYVESGQKLIKLGDKSVAWDDSFRLFFTTKLGNPHYSPEVMAKTMLINYSVTQDGLANQLLNVVVGHERPDLEEQFSALVADMSANALMIVKLEDTLLHELSASEGNILDNSDLIETLNQTKETSTAIKAKVEQAEFTKTEISKARLGYTPVAKRGSILYFVMASLSTISSMYETSLDSFLGVFNKALDHAKKDVVLGNRLRNMSESVMRDVYDYTCTGIFERHKLMFAFQMTCQVQDGDGKLNRAELDAFLKGDTGLDAPPRPSPVEWLGASGWKDLLALCSMDDAFDALRNDFEKHKDTWKAWYDLEAPETVDLPDEHQEKLSPLQRLCVMRCFRPDRVYNAVKTYVMGAIGEKYVQPPVLNYGRIFAQSTERSPMVFILSPGADPQGDIQLLCEEKGMLSKFSFIALGQGQGPHAEVMIDKGTRSGYWVLLQNCHLLVSWLKMLEKKMELMKAPHKDFRLWMTTEPTERFPMGILQKSLKVVTEPPDGLKLNMKGTFAKIDQALLDACPHPAFRTCLFTLAFLHAVVQERRKYGKIGWNVAYDFNESDFVISRELVSLYLKKSHEDGDEFLPWGSLKYLIGDAMYGGRVSDNMDRRVLVTYLAEYMGDFLFDTCQKFYFSNAGFDYDLPEPGPLENYQRHIEKLPLTNSPAVFGLHPNAEIGFYSNATKNMWVNLISLQPRSVDSGGGLSRDDIIAGTAQDIEGKVPIESLDIGSYDLMVVRSKLFERNGVNVPTPAQVVLLQELERWNLLVIKMAVTLADLQRAFRGEIGMSDQLDALGGSLFNGFIPGMWKKLMPNTQKPLGSWMLHFLDRYTQYDLWISHGEPKVMWLSGLGIPESYLTALVQTTCRALNWPLDKATSSTSVTAYTEVQQVPEKLAQGTFIRGLYLEGAGWDHDAMCLKRQEPKVLVVPLPIIEMVPIGGAMKLNGVFVTPVYVTQDRRNAMGVGLVFEANLASDEHVSVWVLQGVALALNTDT